MLSSTSPVKAQAIITFFDLSSAESREVILGKVPTNPEDVMLFFGGIYQASEYLENLFSSIDQSLTDKVLSQSESDEFIQEIKKKIFFPILVFSFGATSKKCGGLASYLNDLCTSSSQAQLLIGLTALIEKLLVLSVDERIDCLLQEDFHKKKPMLVSIFSQIHRVTDVAKKNNLVISLCACLNDIVQVDGLPNYILLSALEQIHMHQLFSCMGSIPEFKLYMFQQKEVAAGSRIEENLLLNFKDRSRVEFTRMLTFLADIVTEKPKIVARLISNQEFSLHLLSEKEIFKVNSAEYNTLFAKIVESIGSNAVYQALGTHLHRDSYHDSICKLNLYKFFAHERGYFGRVLDKLQPRYSRGLCSEQCIELLATFNHLKLVYPPNELVGRAELKFSKTKMLDHYHGLIMPAKEAKFYTPNTDLGQDSFVNSVRADSFFHLASKILWCSSSDRYDLIKEIYPHLQPAEKTFLLELLGEALYELGRQGIGPEVFLTKKCGKFLANALCAEQVDPKTGAFAKRFVFMMGSFPDFFVVVPSMPHGLKGFLSLLKISSVSQRLMDIELDPKFLLAVQGSAVQYINNNGPTTFFSFSKSARRKEINQQLTARSLKAGQSGEKQAAVSIDEVKLYPNPCDNGAAYDLNAYPASIDDSQEDNGLYKAPSAPPEGSEQIFDGTERKLPGEPSSSVASNDLVAADADSYGLPVASAVAIGQKISGEQYKSSQTTSSFYHVMPFAASEVLPEVPMHEIILEGDCNSISESAFNTPLQSPRGSEADESSEEYKPIRNFF